MNHYQMKEIKSVQRYPEGFREYMATYGGHFSKAMCEWAVGMMRDDNDEKIEPWTKEQVEDLLKRYGVELKNDKGYDKVYVANMCKADYYEDAVPDENHVARYIKKSLDDPDGYDEMVFNRFMMDCIGRGIPIIWEDML